MLYFAYGSNMSRPRLEARVPSARFVTTARLDGHRLTFHKVGADGSGKCDAYATGDPAHCVLGVVFDIAAAEKRALDRIEGLGVGYVEKVVRLLDADGANIEAFLYSAIHIDATLQPFGWYKAHVLAGARTHGLPADYVRWIESVPACDDPDLERAQRELAIYRVLD